MAMKTTDLIVEICKIESYDDLVRLNKTLINQMRVLSKRTSWKFRVGDKVTFDSRKRGQVSGTVTKIMTKNVVVNAGFTNWRVPAAMLKKVA